MKSNRPDSLITRESLNSFKTDLTGGTVPEHLVAVPDYMELLMDPVAQTQQTAEAIASTAPSTFNAAVNDTPTRRMLRSAVQYGATFLVMLVLMGAFSPLQSKYLEKLSYEWKFLASGIVFLALVQIQNYAEKKGIIPPLWSTKADVKQ